MGTSHAAQPLRGKDLANLAFFEDAYLIIEGEHIAGFGSMDALGYGPKEFTTHFDGRHRVILPSWCDSHTHLVFAGSRENEFVDKIKGLSYREIAARGGGILNSAKQLNALSEDQLFRLSYDRLQEIMKLGTGAVEIKSGYGLSLQGEIKMLRVIHRLKGACKIPIRSTFLGAHTFPELYKNDHQGYIKILIEDMLPLIAAEGLADYIDVFCEEGFFSPQETKTICLAGKQLGLKAKIHAHQLALSGGVQTALQLNAISVDHLERMDLTTIKLLANSGTIGTLLPASAFFLGLPYQKARSMIDLNCAIAVASDYNPGSCPSGNMNFVLSLCCIQMGMLPEEAINAATINGAFAMELAHRVGSITVGKMANLIVTQPMPSLAYLPYRFGNNLIDKVMLCGEWL
ncbi:MAG: imidazolonepropionase [Flavisolibacter sp.]